MKRTSSCLTVPNELIAQAPNDADDRSNARLMVVHRDTGEIEHKQFVDIVDYLHSGDIVIGNDVKPLPSILRCIKNKTRAPIELSLTREIDRESCTWGAYVSPSRKVRMGNRIHFDDSKLVAEVIDNTTPSERVVSFNTKSYDELLKILYEIGYINVNGLLHRNLSREEIGFVNSIYEGDTYSVIPSISGLHFTEKIILQLQLKDVTFTTLTSRIKSPDVHRTIKNLCVSTDYCNIDMRMINDVKKTKRNANRVCSVGLSTMNALEASMNLKFGSITPICGPIETAFDRIHAISVTDILLTNFYVPYSLQFINTTFFCSENLLTKAYNEAIKGKYNFLLYGDSLLII